MQLLLPRKDIALPSLRGTREEGGGREDDAIVVGESAYYDWSRISFFSLNTTATRREESRHEPWQALTALWQTQCFIIDTSQGGSPVSGSLLWDSASLFTRGGMRTHPTERGGGRGAEGRKLRLTVNFVVPGWSEISERRDWPSAPLEIRTHPSIANRRRSRDLRSHV